MRLGWELAWQHGRCCYLPVSSCWVGERRSLTDRVQGNDRPCWSGDDGGGFLRNGLLAGGWRWGLPLGYHDTAGLFAVGACDRAWRVLDLLTDRKARYSQAYREALATAVDYYSEHVCRFAFCDVGNEEHCRVRTSVATRRFPACSYQDVGCGQIFRMQSHLSRRSGEISSWTRWWKHCRLRAPGRIS